MGGTGRNEPVMTVTHYGKGRVFYQALGHLWAGVPTNGYIGCTLIALENPGFQQTLIRGCEWAATGTVTAVAGRQNLNSMYNVGVIGLGSISMGYGSPGEAAPYCHVGGDPAEHAGPAGRRRGPESGAARKISRQMGREFSRRALLR